MATVSASSPLPSAQAIDVARKKFSLEVQRLYAQLEQLHQWRADYNKVRELLNTLPQETQREVMVPFGPRAFFPGRLVHTNEITVLLGDNLFAERSAFQARQIVSRRLEYVQQKIDEVKKNIEEIETRLGLTEQLRAEVQMLDQEDFVEIREPYFSDDDLLNMSSDGEEEQQHSASQCNQNASGENMSRLLSPASLVQMATDAPPPRTEDSAAQYRATAADRTTTSLSVPRSEQKHSSSDKDCADGDVPATDKRKTLVFGDIHENQVDFPSLQSPQPGPHPPVLTTSLRDSTEGENTTSTKRVSRFKASRMHLND